MALGALAEDPNCGVKIVPCGMNYFHAHKFRSRAVVEFGTPVEIPNELVEMYKNGQKREAVGQVLETVYQALVSVTVTSPDYDTLMVCWSPLMTFQSIANIYPAHSSSQTLVQPQRKEAPSTHDRRIEQTSRKGIYHLQGRSSYCQPKEVYPGIQQGVDDAKHSRSPS